MDRNDQELVRRERRAQMIARNIELYPARVKRSIEIKKLIAAWTDGRPVSVVGRVREFRRQGGAAFLKIDDDTAAVQIFIQQKNIANYKQIMTDLDLGDFVQVSGRTFITARGEKTVEAKDLTWLAKALRPLPSKWHGLEDIEIRYRFRELDLLAHPEVKEVFRRRSELTRLIREFLTAKNFIEVETPILQSLPGGATARPFITHHQALGTDLYLRIAPELYLKRLIVGGYGRVFEMARCFRNEGIDRDHNPEFTQVELYIAYQDYTWLMKFLEKMMVTVVKKLFARTDFVFRGQQISFDPPWPRLTYRAAIMKYAGLDIDALTNLAELRAAASAKHTDLTGKSTRPQIIDEIFKTHVRPKLIAPTIVHDYPLELSPLAKKIPDQPGYTERFQLLMGGTEIANAFSELNDPVDQRERFEAQEKLRQAGDDEAQRIDETYLRSMEYGLPPTAGLGLGIDRLIQVLTDQPAVKDVILFPTLRPNA